jgi:hypothetical protein
MKSTYLYGFLISLFIIASYALLVILSPEKANNLGREDGVIETCSAICYFLSACLFFFLFFRSKSKGKYLFGTNRNYFFLLLGLIFLFCLGEEISWGQRIFNLSTPESLKEINNQSETNLHNIKFIEAENDKSGLARWINADRIFTLFWFCYCVLIPILNKLSSKTQNFLEKLDFPVVPLWIAPFFILNFVFENLIEHIAFFGPPPRFGETYENNMALLFLLIGISFYYTSRKTMSRTIAT